MVIIQRALTDTFCLCASLSFNSNRDHRSVHEIKKISPKHQKLGIKYSTFFWSVKWNLNENNRLSCERPVPNFIGEIHCNRRNLPFLKIEDKNVFRQEGKGFSLETNNFSDDTQKAGGIEREIEEAAALGAEAIRSIAALRGNALKLSARDITLDGEGNYNFFEDHINSLWLKDTFTGNVSVGMFRGTTVEINRISVEGGNLTFGYTDLFIIRSGCNIKSNASVDFRYATFDFLSDFWCGLNNILLLNKTLFYFHGHPGSSFFNSTIQVLGASTITAARNYWVFIDSLRLEASLLLSGGGHFALLDASSGNGVITVDLLTTLTIPDSSLRVPDIRLVSGARIEFGNRATSGVINIDFSEGIAGSGCTIAFMDYRPSQEKLSIAVSIRNFQDGVRLDFPNLKFAGATFLRAYYEAGKIHVLYTVDGSDVREIIFDDVTGAGLYDGKELKVLDDGSGGTEIETCFLAGTMIKTPDGWRAVETLSPGDYVVTIEDGIETETPLRWVGYGDTTCRLGLPDDLAGYPVRIAPNAIAPGVPFDEVRITSEHCLFIDGGLIPVRMLVNGDSIAYLRDVPRYRFYHIETPCHAIINASGLLTETYLDTGNRDRFCEGHGVISLPSDRNTQLAAPLIVAPSEVEPIYHRLAQFALMSSSHESHERECNMTHDPNLRIVLPNGQELRPTGTRQNVVIFTLPIHVSDVTLLSRTSRPCDVIGPFIDDRRSLGVLVGDILVVSNHAIADVSAHLIDANLKGWHGLETTSCRWTEGCARIPLPPAPPTTQAFRALHVQILQSGPYLMDDSKEEPSRCDAIAS